jgi:hypothetical protein
LFNITYLSNDRIRQLRKLNERLANTTDQRVRNETNLLIQEIQNEAIPYTSCDLFKAAELRNQILDKIVTLNSLGKAQSVEIFQMHLKEVDFHIETKRMEEALKEKNRVKPDEGPNLREHATSLNDLKKEKRKQAVKGRTRWTVGMDEDAE